MFSEEAVKLAKPLVEAIKKIAERQEIECIVCNGTGRFPYIADLGRNPCSRCKGTGKVKGRWEWEPLATDWVLFRGEARILMDTPKSAHRDEYVPLLHWEELEEILEGMEYYVYFCNKREPGDNVYVEIRRGAMFNEMIVMSQSKTRQEAVQKAVIELGKKE